MGDTTCLKILGNLPVDSSQPCSLPGRPPGRGQRRGSGSTLTRRLCYKLRTAGVKCVLESFKSATSHGQNPACQVESTLRKITKMGIHRGGRQKASTFHSLICQQHLKASVGIIGHARYFFFNLQRYRWPELSQESCSLLLSYAALTCSFNRPVLIYTYHTWAPVYR